MNNDLAPAVQWVLLIGINVLIFFLFYPPRTWKAVLLKKEVAFKDVLRVLAAVLVSDITLHIINAVLTGKDQMLGWFIVSFPYVFLVNVCVVIALLMGIRLFSKFHAR